MNSKMCTKIVGSLLWDLMVILWWVLFGWVFCQVHFMPPMSFKLPAHFFNFWAAKGLNIFCLLKNLPPKLRLPMIFAPRIGRLLGLCCPLYLSPLSLSFYLFIIWQLFEALLKIQTTYLIIFWTYWEQIESFQVQISCCLCISFGNDVQLKLSYWNGYPAKKI